VLSWYRLFLEAADDAPGAKAKTASATAAAAIPIFEDMFDPPPKN
jgi:hypothetical protein